MPSDSYFERALDDDEPKRLARARYVRQHAPSVAAALVGGMVNPAGAVRATAAAIARSAVEITAALYDALPDEDAEPPIVTGAELRAQQDGGAR